MCVCMCVCVFLVGFLYLRACALFLSFFFSFYYHYCHFQHPFLLLFLFVCLFHASLCSAFLGGAVPISLLFYFSGLVGKVNDDCFVFFFFFFFVLMTRRATSLAHLPFLSVRYSAKKKKTFGLRIFYDSHLVFFFVCFGVSRWQCWFIFVLEHV